MDRRKVDFIKALAVFLVENQAGKSINLELESTHARHPALPAWAKEWAHLRTATTLRGYPTLEEAEKELADWLGITLP